MKFSTILATTFLALFSTVMVNVSADPEVQEDYELDQNNWEELTIDDRRVGVKESAPELAYYTEQDNSSPRMKYEGKISAQGYIEDSGNEDEA